MGNKNDNTQVLEDFVSHWSSISQKHPEITVGEWLRAMSVISGLAMSLADMTGDQVSHALGAMAEISANVYENADKHIQKATLQ